MSKVAIIPEPISRNVFEQYYRLIDYIKTPIISERRLEDKNVKILSALTYLEKVINSIERCTQDLSDQKSASQITTLTIELLDSWLPVLGSSISNRSYTLVQFFDAFSYNFFPIISVLETYKNAHYIATIRYLGRLNSGIEKSNLIRELYVAEVEKHLKDSAVSSGHEDFFNNLSHPTWFARGLKSQRNEQANTFDYRRIDPTEMTQAMKESFNVLAYPFLKRFIDDYFNYLNLFAELKQLEDIEEVRKAAANIDFSEPLERLFFFDDSTQIAVWDVFIEFTSASNSFNAAELGFTLWSFSKALESIDNVEVELISCGDGSKWFDLKIKIRSVASKVDINQVLKKVRQALEVYHTKKPVEEIEKFEAERDKLESEAIKIQTETKNLRSEEHSKLLHELEIHEKILDIQKKELEIEDKKADVRMKNLDYISKLSELMVNGIIENNSDIKIFINTFTFIDKTDTEITVGNEDLLDINEKIEPENPNTSMTQSDTDISQII